MPICPGCEQEISYERLDAHERYCSGLRGPEQSSSESIERLERRLDRVEGRLERRMDRLEATLQGGAKTADDGPDSNSRRLRRKR